MAVSVMSLKVDAVTHHDAATDVERDVSVDALPIGHYVVNTCAVPPFAVGPFATATDAVDNLLNSDPHYGEGVVAFPSGDAVVFEHNVGPVDDVDARMFYVLAADDDDDAD